MTPGTPDPDVEQFTETITESVEMGYSHGTLQSISVIAQWKRGEQVVDDPDNRWVVDEETVIAHYRIDGDTAELRGFYPKTGATGEQLHRKTLLCLRALDHVTAEVRERVDDDVTIEQPDNKLLAKLRE